MYKNEDGIILELKVDNTAEAAIRQIKEKNYALKFKGKLGQDPTYTGRIMAVGISYDKKTKSMIVRWRYYNEIQRTGKNRPESQ